MPSLVGDSSHNVLALTSVDLVVSHNLMPHIFPPPLPLPVLFGRTLLQPPGCQPPLDGGRPQDEARQALPRARAQKVRFG